MLHKTITFILLVVFFSCSLSQNNTNNPYSRFGIGELHPSVNSQSLGMGRTAIALNNPNHINITNPACLSSLDTLSVLFEFGVQNRISVLKTNDLEQNNNNINIANLSLGFPVAKFWFTSFNLSPMSSVGYNIQYNDTTSDSLVVQNKYEGNGGINRFTLSNCIKPFRFISLGINASYLFGNLSQKNTIDFPEDNYQPTLYDINKLYISDVKFDFGLNFTHTFTDSVNGKVNKYKIDIGAIYGYQDEINAYRTNLAYKRYSYNIEDTIQDIEQAKDYFTLPSTIGFGAAITRNNKFTLAVDYIMQDWSDTRFLGFNDSLAKSSYMLRGLEYTPEEIDFQSPYWKNMSYRIGGFYGKDYLKLRGNHFANFGITFGVGFPFRSQMTSFMIKGRPTRSSINIGFEYGQKGTTDNNLIKEDYFLFHINVTLYDVWFVKRKID